MSNHGLRDGVLALGSSVNRELKASTLISFPKAEYSGIPDSLKRLKQMMVEHHLHIAPDNTTARPPVQKKPRLSAEREA